MIYVKVGFKPKTCDVCSSAFTPQSSSQKRCSSSCREIAAKALMQKHYRYQRQSVPASEVCVICQTTFAPKSAVTKVCSMACRGKEYRQRFPDVYRAKLAADKKKTQEKYSQLEPKHCVICSATLTPHNIVMGATICSRACAIKRDGAKRTPEQIKASRNRAKAKNPNAFKDAAQNNRAMRKSRFKAKVYRAQIYKRDKYLCQLCLGPLFLSAKIPNHPKSDCCEVTCFRAPTIDHIIPLANGGWHEPSNVQAAHFICNSRKSNKGATLNTELK